MLARARGTQRLWRGEGTGDIQLQPGTDNAWALFDEALKAAQAGETSAALGHAVAAVEEFGEIFDDYLHMWSLAMELAMACHDRQAEAELLDLVDGAPVVPPLGLRAHRARFGALLAVRDEGAGADETEALLRRAVELYTQWGALAYRARALGELGGFLRRQGRPDEAGPLLDEARQFLTSVGARTWLDELELSLVGTA